MPNILKSLALAFGLLAIGLGAVQAQTPARDPAAEQANLELVLEFNDLAFNQHEVDKAAEFLADDYIQHNPTAGTGREAAKAALTGLFEAFPQSRGRVARSAASGDLVFIHVHWKPSPEDRGSAIVDIYRIEDGKIAEHWDVIQEVPETAANDNTMF